MSQELFVNLNGQLLSADKPLFALDNRAFRYGDALFETIRCHQLVPLLFDFHYERLIRGMSMLEIQFTHLPSREQLLEFIANLITRNRIYGDCRVRLTVFRADGGLYTPESNKPHFLIETTPLSTKGYELNEKGLLVDVYTEERKSESGFSPFKTGNSLLFVMAGLHKSRSGLNDVLITNTKGKIIEALASNLFWIKENVFYTPLRSSGCVDGVMRRQVLLLLKQNGYEVQELVGATKELLLDADEIFITNAIQGIQWVVGLDDKRYFSKLTKVIAKLLNEPFVN